MLTYPLPISFLTEELLQFIWQHRYYNGADACTVQGDPVTILHPGVWNRDQGPDFLGARIMIGPLLWVGHVELHIRTSHWDAHRHNGDLHYDNVILHAVWQHDKQVSGSQLAILELQPLVAGVLLQRYALLMHSSQMVACQGQLPALSGLAWLAWTERLAIERLTRKAGYVLELLAVSGNHWEEVFWWLLARNFGMKVNADLFEQVAKSLPVTLLARHKASVPQLEALLLGQANLLNGHFTDAYPVMLQKEYRFLKHKYNLPTLKAQPGFLRMRPAAFPTLRLAQLATLLHQSTHLFSYLREAGKLEDVTRFFDVTANDYWHYHYRPDEPTAFMPKKPGITTIHNIIINTIVPVLFAYGVYKEEENIKERAIDWLSQTPKEENKITKQWAQVNIHAHNATDTQALIELKNNYCTPKRCLECAIGNKILRPM
jgi:hypothetical protein